MRLISSLSKDLCGFNVRRFLPSVQQKMLGPWVFFDHFGPRTLTPPQALDVRPHPHINLATVTYLFEGEFYHRDSLGSAQSILPGDLNLMVAGKGITHSEREPNSVRNRARVLHGLQLWLALPEAYEEVDPSFEHYPAKDLPKLNGKGFSGTLMIGKAWGARSPVKVFSQTLYASIHLDISIELDLPEAEELGVCVLKGEITADGTKVTQHEMIIFENQGRRCIQATKDSHIVVLGGEQLTPRFIDWNFVSSRKERIEQAKVDWSSGRFPKVVGDEGEFIPFPTKS